MLQIFSFSFSKRWLIVIGLLLLLIVSSLFYTYNQFYRQDRIGLEVLQGIVTKTSAGVKQIIPNKGENVFPGDLIEVSKDSSVAMIFHDGSVLSFVAGDKIKYDYFTSIDQHNHFNFNNLSQNTNFEYITQSYLSKAGAVILGRESSMDGRSKSKVLGAVDKKLSDTEKVKMWNALNKCIQEADKNKIYQETLNKCLNDNNIASLESLSS